MIIKGLVDEDFANYKKPSMFIAFPSCNWKCERECGERVCQNNTLAQAPDITIEAESIVDRYLTNPITHSIVIGGLEPFDDYRDLLELISYFRFKKCYDDIVIYTGYTEEECKGRGYLFDVQSYGPIIIKFGRFIPNQQSHYDEVLGVKLASDNQYGKKILGRGYHNG
jgi:hypothetical protein